MTRSPARVALFIAVVTLFVTHELFATPAPPFLSCSIECSDAYVIKYCDIQVCDHSSLPDCSDCQLCRYRSAGEPNLCQLDPLGLTLTVTTGTCDEDCLCGLGLNQVEAKNFVADSLDPVPNVPRHCCSNSLVQPGGSDLP